VCVQNLTLLYCPGTSCQVPKWLSGPSGSGCKSSPCVSLQSPGEVDSGGTEVDMGGYLPSLGGVSTLLGKGEQT
jgi:hypothetical protein